jgi:catechol 2,3-dioxygenase
MSKKDLKFTHLGIYAHDLAPMEEFYCQMLGMTVTDRGVLKRNGKTASLTFMSKDPDEHHQLVLVSGRPKNIDFGLINQISFRTSSISSLRDVYLQFREEYTGEIDAVSHGNAVSFYVLDPEGNRVEIYWDTPWYVSQPMTESIDLAQPTDALLHMVKERALKLPGFKPHAEWRAEMVSRMAESQAATAD